MVAHPGGYKAGRTPPVRLGRILGISSTTLTTDCVLVGGDSGGPLFDMTGKVIGINSRIGQLVTSEHARPGRPVHARAWDRLAKGEVFGGKLVASSKNFPAVAGQWILGIASDPTRSGCAWSRKSVPNSPAEKAGLKVNGCGF